jgi:hypothetical protein
MTGRPVTLPRPYLYIASMDVGADHDALFNEVYDTEHLPKLAEVPGVLGVGRYERVDFEMSIGGEVVPVAVSQPRYHAVYALESAEVLTSDAWAAAVEAGRWPSQVRPHTTNRHHMLARALAARGRHSG